MHPLRLISSPALSCAGLTLAFTVCDGLAQEVTRKTSKLSGVTALPTVNVFAGKDSNPAMTGSAAIIGREEIQNQNYTNPNRVLQQVPGVYVRDEDGYGNFPNITLRGTDSVRSAKTTIMEDGILMSPAPYTFPAAYHTPRMGRVSGVEVFKGSTQLRHGPRTTGGVINCLSMPFVPLTQDDSAGSASKGYVKSTYGSDNTWFNHAWWGYTQQSSAGQFGVILELFHNQSDGFRHIDKAADKTGFSLVEPMIRMFWEPNTDLKQRFEFRFGYSDFDADETHLGLTDSDLRADSHRRYASTQFDNFSSEQFRYSLRHMMQLSESVRLETTAYHTYYTRNWYMLTDIATPAGKTIPLATALATPGQPLDILRGDAAGTWRIRANDRYYNTIGIQSQVDWKFQTGALAHELTAGVRVHYDDGVRFERDDIVTINGRGEVVSYQRGRQGAAGNRVEEVLALSMFAEDKIRIGSFTIKPGLRWEHMEMAYEDRATSGADLSRVIASDSGTEDALAPGVSVSYDLNKAVNLYGSYYRGISNPAPREFLRGDARMETTEGFELGARYAGKSVQAQVTGFHVTYHNMIANDGLGGLGTIEDSNAGDARIYGVEGSVRWDPLADSGTDLRLPLRASATWTHSEFIRGNPRATSGSIYAGAKAGNELPYVPHLTASLGIGVEYRDFGVYLDGTYISEMFGSASNATNLRDPDGNADARYGKTDSAFVFDLSVRYQLNASARLVTGISNLTDEEYVTSRLPSGARANQPRSFYVGFDLRF